MNQEQTLKYYINCLYNYCNTIDNKAISRALLSSSNNELKLRDIYTDLNVVPRDKYEHLYNPLDNSMFSSQKKIYSDSNSKQMYTQLITNLLSNNRINIHRSTKYIDIDSISKSESKFSNIMTESDIPYSYWNILCTSLSDDSILYEYYKPLYVLILNENSIPFLPNNKYILTGYEIEYSVERLFIVETYIENSSYTIPYSFPTTPSDHLIPISNNSYFIKDLFTIYNTFGELVYSSFGGGKTTYLKNKTIHYCKSYIDSKKTDDLLFPIFISSKKINQNIANNIDSIEFKQIIYKSLYSIISFYNDNCTKDVYQIYNYLTSNNTPILLIIDDIDLMSQNNIYNILSEQISNNQLNIRHLIASSNIQNANSSELISFCRNNNISEKIICDFKNDNTILFKFIETWLYSFNKINPLIDTKKELTHFKKLYNNNHIVQNTINTPIELTNLLILFISSYSIPTNTAALYKASIDLWLQYNIKLSNIEISELEDIYLELSRISYFMSQTNNDNQKISYKNISKIIEETKEMFSDYYINQSYKNLDLQDKIKIISNSCILEYEDGFFSFKHIQYQAFFSAYCIIKNYVTKGNTSIIGIKRQLNKINYLNDYINCNNILWTQIILFVSYMDKDLHNRIIEKLIYSIQTNNYTIENIETIIQLLNSECFQNDSEIVKSFYDIIFNHEELWRYISLKKNKVKIENMLTYNSEENNSIFLREGLIKHSYLRNNNKNKSIDFKNTFDYFFFYVILECKYESVLLNEIINTYFTGYISNTIIDLIKHNFKDIKNDIFLNAVSNYDLCTYKKETENYDKFNFIIPAIKAFTKPHPFKTALDYFNDKGNDYSFSIASRIVILISLMICDKGNVYSEYLSTELYELEQYNSLYECKKIILRGLTDSNSFIRDYSQSAFECLRYSESLIPLPVEKEWSIKPSDNVLNKLNPSDVFTYYLDKCKNEELYQTKDGNINKCFITLAMFSLYKNDENTLYQIELDETKIKQLYSIYNNSSSPKQSIMAFKILLWANAFNNKSVVYCFNNLESRLKSNIHKTHIAHYYEIIRRQLKQIELTKLVNEIQDNLLN